MKQMRDCMPARQNKDVLEENDRRLETALRMIAEGKDDTGYWQAQAARCTVFQEMYGTAENPMEFTEGWYSSAGDTTSSLEPPGREIIPQKTKALKRA